MRTLQNTARNSVYLLNWVQVATDDRVEVNVTTDADLGTIYSVAVPVKRVRPTARFDIQGQLEVTSLLWDLEMELTGCFCLFNDEMCQL